MEDLNILDLFDNVTLDIPYRAGEWKPSNLYMDSGSGHFAILLRDFFDNFEDISF